MLVSTISVVRKQWNILAGMGFETPVLGKDKGKVEYGMEASRASICWLKASTLIGVGIMGWTPLNRGNWVEIQWYWKYRINVLQSPIRAPSTCTIPSSALTGKSMNPSTSPETESTEGPTSSASDILSD
jgi:hypothetical protein